MTPRTCLLCGGAATSWYAEPARDYWRCDTCALVFLSPEQRPDSEAEVRRYRLHQNRDDDAGYRAFLSRLAQPMIRCVPEGGSGLDYGCGPAPVLAELMTRSGRPTVSYDPVFAPDETLIATRYDFVTCSEVVEHAHDPRALFTSLARLVKPAGTIGVMTRWYEGRDFATWSYRRDPTHVCFYCERTMQWVAGHFRWTLSLPATDIAIFTDTQGPGAVP